MEGEEDEDNEEPQDVSSIWQSTAPFFCCKQLSTFYMILNFYIKLPA
jgi:hypothetical protein